MGGTLLVASVEGRGTEFWFTLTMPAAEAPRGGGEAADPWVRPRAAEGERAPLRVLLVEDNVVNQEVAASLLRGRGHVVRIADNGREAVEAVRVGPGDFDVILM